MKYLFLVFSLFLFFSSCKKESPQAVSLSGSGSGTCSAGGATVASGDLLSFDGLVIRNENLPGDIKQLIYNNQFEAYKKNEMLLQELAVRIDIAKQQGLFTTVENVPSIDQLLKPKEVTDQQAEDFFNTNKDRMPPGSNFNDIKENIVKYLTQSNLTKAYRDYAANMLKSGKYKVLMAAPEPLKVVIDTQKYPSYGNKNAKVKVIEVSDYMCGHCQAAHSKVKEILEKYKDKINFVQINYALNEKGMSGSYIRGAYCAQALSIDTFWKYHHKAFEVAAAPHDHRNHTQAGHNDGNSEEAMGNVEKVVSSLGINFEEFKKCLTSDVASKFVSDTNSILSGKGIMGTPTFIVNDVKIDEGIAGLEKAIEDSL